MRKTTAIAAAVLAALAAAPALAQKSATESIEEYRQMMADGNPADLF